MPLGNPFGLGDFSDLMKDCGLAPLGSLRSLEANLARSARGLVSIGSLRSARFARGGSLRSRWLAPLAVCFGRLAPLGSLRSRWLAPLAFEGGSSLRSLSGCELGSVELN